MKISLKLAIVSAVIFLSACAMAPRNPVLGAWEIEMDTPIGALPGTITFTEGGEGTMMIEAPGSEGQPPATFENAVYDENTVAFTTTIDAQGQQVTLQFDGTVEEDELTGQFDTDFGVMGVSGTRKE